MPQRPVAKAEISQPTKQENVELQKAYATLIDERDLLADKVKIEKDKRAKAGRRPHIKPEMIEKINKLHYQGLTQMKIAEEVGYSVFTVNRVINGFIN